MTELQSGEDGPWEYDDAAPCPECGQPGPGSYEWDDYGEFLEALSFHDGGSDG